MAKNANSDRLFAEACEWIPGGVNTSLRNVPPHIVFRSAHGALLKDVDGNEYIDYLSAFGPIILGHNFEAVNRRVIETLQKLDLLGTAVTEIEIKLAKKICESVPSAERVLLCNSGSEATYHAIRLARAITGRKKIIKFQGCYHGWHDYIAMNVISAPERVGQVDPLSAGSLAEGMAQTVVCAFNSLDDVERAIAENRDQIAAIIIEPVAHNMGAVLPNPGFLEGLREITRLSGSLLIFDEVITGFRHGLGGYQKLCGVTPDLTAIAKSMANGFPIAAICGKQMFMDRFNTRVEGDVFFTGTFNGNAASCAASLATIETLETQNVHQHIFQLGDRLRKSLKEIIDRLKVRATVAGFGSIFVVYFMEGPASSYTDLLKNDQQSFVTYRQEMIKRGIFEVPVNLKRSHLSFSHTDEHVARTLQAAEDVLKTMFKPASRRSVTAEVPV
jgi:glutamate-1-semialdehyde 2,1-aminomutase